MEKTKEILIAIATALKSCRVTYMNDDSVEILRFGKEYRITKNADDFRVESIIYDVSHGRDDGCVFLEKKLNGKESGGDQP